MATATSDNATNPRQYSDGAVAVTTAAGVLMIMAGIFHIVQGVVALVSGDFYVQGEEYIFSFDLTAWGWTHLFAGTLVLFAGMALFTGAVWARTVAVILSGVSIVTSFLWLPYYPIWSLTVIAFDVFVIWAVTAHGRDISRI